MFRRPSLALVVLALSALFVRPGWAQISDVTPSLDVSTRDDFNLTRSEENNEVTNTSFIRQSHLVSVDIPLNPVLLLSTNILYSDLDTRTDSRTDAGIKQIATSSNETFEPRGELLWDNPYFTWNNGYRFRKTDIESNISGETITRDNFFSRLTIDESTFVPRSEMRYEWVKRSDNLLVPETETNANQMDIELTKYVGPFRLRYEFGGDRDDDDITHVTQDRLSQMGVVTFNQSFFSNAIDIFGEYSIDADRRITKTPPTGGTIEENRDRVDGLYLDGKNDPDATPANPLDDPLDTGFSDLIDTVTTVAADPPGGNANVNLDDDLQNVAVRLQIAQEVNVIYVYITDPSPPTSEAGLDGVTWRVFTGTAPDTWTEVAGVTSDFNSTDNRFEITLPAAVTSRFFRVRNTNQAGEDIYVTEMEVIGQETFLTKVRRVQEQFDQDASARVTLRPFRFLSFIYDVLYSEINDRPEADQNLERVNTGTVRFTPHPLLNATAQVQRNFFDQTGDDEFPETEDRYSAVLTSTPLPTLTQSATFSRTERSERQQVGDVDTERDDTFLYTINGEIYRDFTVGLDLNWFRSWDFAQSLPSEITSKATLRVDAQVRPDLRITGDYEAGRRYGGDLESRQRISSGEFIVTYRPTPRINSEARLRFLTEEATRGLDQEYRLNWIVFTEGALELLTDYRYERTENDSTEEHQGGLTMHWKVNKKLILDLGWVVFSENNGDRLLRHSGTLTIVFRL